MMELEQTPRFTKKDFVKANIELRSSPIHRYGVFATKDIAPKEIIEECPVLIFYQSAMKNPVEASNRAFSWNDQYNAISLGYGSLYNHADQPNACFDNDYENKILRFTALKPIPAGTEILINYGDDWFTSRGMRAVSKEDLEKINNRRVFKVLTLFFVLLVLSQAFPANWLVNRNTKNVNRVALANNYFYPEQKL